MKNSLGLKRLKFSYNTNHSEYHKKKSILNNNLWPSKKYEPNRYLFGKALLCMNNLYCTLGGHHFWKLSSLLSFPRRVTNSCLFEFHVIEFYLSTEIASCKNLTQFIGT